MSTKAPSTQTGSGLKAISRLKSVSLSSIKTHAQQAPPDENEEDQSSDTENPPKELDPSLDEGPSMDPEEGDDPEALVDEDDEAFTLEDVIKCFLRANPNPTDEQVHAFAELMGLSYEEFEAEVFRKFGEVVRLATDLGPSESEEDQEIEDNLEVDSEDPQVEEDDSELQADDSLGVEDDIDMFIVAYILYNPQPSDDQIHQLAFVVDLTKEQMEQRIYRMLGSFLKINDETFDSEASDESDENQDSEDLDNEDIEDTEDTGDTSDESDDTPESDDQDNSATDTTDAKG